MLTRAATPDDAAAIARIYNEGIEDRQATFETEPRAAADVIGWLQDGVPLVVEEVDGDVVAWASAPVYNSRAAYAGVREFSIYVARDRRGGGVGAPTLQALLDECERGGVW